MVVGAANRVQNTSLCELHCFLENWSQRENITRGKISCYFKCYMFISVESLEILPPNCPPNAQSPPECKTKAPNYEDVALLQCLIFVLIGVCLINIYIFKFVC